MSAVRRLLAVERIAGLLPYGDGLARQAALAAARSAGRGTDTLLLCEVRRARRCSCVRVTPRGRVGRAPWAVLALAGARACVRRGRCLRLRARVLAVRTP
jgi:hypothetical protein